MEMRNRGLALIVVLVLWYAYDMRPLIPGRDGPPMRDFEAYYAAGVTFARGEDPYSRAIWQVERTMPGVDDRHEELLPYVGPPAALPLFALLARLPYLLACRVWGGVLGLCVGIALFALIALFDARRTWTTVTGMLLFVLGYGPLTSGAALGQVALASFTAIVLTLLALRYRQTTNAALATFFAALQPNLALILAARIRERRSLIAFGAAFAVFLALSMWCGGGPMGLLHYLQQLRIHGQAERLIAIQVTAVAIAWELGANAAFASVAGTAVAIAGLVAVLLAIRATRDVLERVALACVALPFVVPFFHEHDFTVAIFPTFLLAVRARGRALAIGMLGSAMVAVDWLGLGQRPVGAVQHIALVTAGVFGLALLSHARGWPRFAGLLACFAAAPVAFIARHTPVAIWPDGLPEGFAPASWFDASAVWHAEQATAGLEQQIPMWGILKLFTLAGCVALFAAVVIHGQDRRAVPRLDVDVQEIVERRDLVGMKSG
jgi:hypothetical protein